MKKWGKAFQAEESGYTQAWEHKGACLPPEIDGRHMSPVRGHRRGEEADKASWGHIVDALICLAVNFILSAT